MRYRHMGWLVGLLALVTVSSTSQAAQPGPPQGAAPTPVPPNPADWVCQDPVPVVRQAAIDAWCGTQVERGQPAPMRLQRPPALEHLPAKDHFDVALQAFLRRRTPLTWSGTMTSTGG